MNSFSSEKKYEVSIREELSDNEKEKDGPANRVLYSGKAMSDILEFTSGVRG